MPEKSAADQVIGLLRQVAPLAGDIAARKAAKPQLMDAGANLERILCTECLQEQDIDWWVGAVTADHTPQGFRLADVEMPCCGAKMTLNELAYHGAQAFGIFAIEVIDPKIKTLSEQVIETAEAALGTPLTVVYYQG